MPLVATVPLAPTDLAWRVIGLVNLYRLLVPPALYLLYLYSRHRNADRLRASRSCSSGPASSISPPASPSSLGGRRLLPNLRATTFVHAMVDAVAISLHPVLERRRRQRPRHPVRGAGRRHGAARGQPRRVPAGGAGDRWRCSRSRSAGTSPARASSDDYPTAGILGGIVFLVALLAWPIARRLRDTEATVRRQQVDLANLAQLSQYIVQHLRESIVVVDHENRIRLINESAAHLLGDRRAYPGALLGEASPQLLYLLETWRQRTATPGRAVADLRRRRRRPRGPAAFRLARRREPSPVIVFLEDTELLAAKIQQSKLAGLGRLSASIAHEIRNPVGAMSHAAQLLGESPSLSAEDKRLTEIVRTNGDRVRQIIENVMSMSRRENSRPERLVLGTWLDGFPRGVLRDHADRPGAARRRPRCSATSKCRSIPRSCARSSGTCARTRSNTARAKTGSDAIELRVGRLASTARPFLEVADRGPGIAAAASRAHLRAVLHRQRTRHGPGPVPRARARADQRRHSSI